MGKCDKKEGKKGRGRRDKSGHGEESWHRSRSQSPGNLLSMTANNNHEETEVVFNFKKKDDKNNNAKPVSECTRGRGNRRGIVSEPLEVGKIPKMQLSRSIDCSKKDNEKSVKNEQKAKVKSVVIPVTNATKDSIVGKFGDDIVVSVNAVDDDFHSDDDDMMLAEDDEIYPVPQLDVTVQPQPGTSEQVDGGPVASGSGKIDL